MKIAIIYHSEKGNTQKMAELVKEGCVSVPGVEAKCMSIDGIDEAYVTAAKAVIVGAPTYEGSCSWQMKRFLDTGPAGMAGKLAGVFASQGFPGGGAPFAEMSIIAGLLVLGMMVYSGGTTLGKPFLHFGAVSTGAPEDDIWRQRCVKLGQNIASKAVELYGEA